MCSIGSKYVDFGTSIVRAGLGGGGGAVPIWYHEVRSRTPILQTSIWGLFYIGGTSQDLNGITCDKMLVIRITIFDSQKLLIYL